MRYLIFLIFLSFGFQNINSQSLSGTVLDAKTNEPLAYVAVYYGGTSIGTTTNFRGQFTIPKYENTQATLNFRFVGYQSQSISNPTALNVRTVRLKIEVGQLDAVVIDLDPWSRKKKEIEFKRFFLGETSYARSAKILNINKVQLRFNPSLKKLTATSREPIIVEHPYLGYKITYDLSDFEVEYVLTSIGDYKDGQINYFSSKAYLNGTAFFEDLVITDDRDLRRVQRRRRKLYESSELFLLKSLVKNTTNENQFYLLQKRRKINMEKDVRVRQINGFYRIEFRDKEYRIVDRKKNKSIMKLERPYMIVSPYYNIIEPNTVLFAGFLGQLKVTGILPLNYEYIPDNEGIYD